MVVLWWSFWTIAAVLVASCVQDVRSSLDWPPSTSNDFHATQRNANKLFGRSAGRPSKYDLLLLNAAMAEMHCALKLLSIMRAVCHMQEELDVDDDDDRVDGEWDIPPSLVMDSCSAPLHTASRFCTAATASGNAFRAASSSPSSSPSSSSFRPWARLEEKLQVRGRRQNGSSPSDSRSAFYAARGRRSYSESIQVKPEVGAQRLHRHSRADSEGLRDIFATSKG